MKRPWLNLLYLLYCAEAGVYLLLVPWSVLWVPMTFHWPDKVRAVLIGGPARGAISAFGLYMLVIGGIDLLRFCRAIRSS